jgi:peroxiredoxin (alkyl hydroperoxide reductase subunit C)
MTNLKKTFCLSICVAMLWAVLFPTRCLADETTTNAMIYDPGPLKPVDSVLAVKIGDTAPSFSLPSLTSGTVSLAQYRGTRNVVISFVPAAWTPVCSDQWPGYNIVQDIFARYDATLLGITVDNLPTLFAWTRQMGDLWFPVLSDFWPHGEVASRFGVLRSDGTAERAVFIIDKAGIIRYISVSDINQRPNLKDIVEALKAIHPTPEG